MSGATLTHRTGEARALIHLTFRGLRPPTLLLRELENLGWSVPPIPESRDVDGQWSVEDFPIELDESRPGAMPESRYVKAVAEAVSLLTTAGLMESLDEELPGHAPPPPPILDDMHRHILCIGRPERTSMIREILGPAGVNFRTFGAATRAELDSAKVNWYDVPPASDSLQWMECVLNVADLVNPPLVDLLSGPALLGRIMQAESGCRLDVNFVALAPLDEAHAIASVAERSIGSPPIMSALHDPRATNDGPMSRVLLTAHASTAAAAIAGDHVMAQSMRVICRGAVAAPISAADAAVHPESAPFDAYSDG